MAPSPSSNRPGGTPDRAAAQATAQAARAATLRRLDRLKTGVAVATMLGFGSLIALVSGHNVGASATPAVSGVAPTDQSPPPQQDDNSGFFDQGGGGSGIGSSAQQPVAGSGPS